MTGNQDALLKHGAVGRRAAEFLDEAAQMFEAAEREVMVYAPERRMNLEYLLRDQWAAIRPNDMALISGQDIYGKNVELLQDNVLADTLIARVSQMVGAVPQFEAVPMTGQQTDMTKAKYVTKMIPGFWHYLKMVSYFRDLLIMAGYYNVAFGKVSWDPTMGRVVDGKPEGEVSLTAVPPFALFVEPGAQRVMPERVQPTDARWLFHRWTTTLGDLKASIRGDSVRSTPSGGSVIRQKPPEGRELAPAGSETNDAENRVVGGDTLRSRTRNVFKTKDGLPGDSAEVHGMTFYQHPDDAHPRGRYALMLPDNGNYVLEYRESLPDDAKLYGKVFPGLFPFFTVWDERVPGRLAGRSRVAAAIPHQRIINQTMTDNEHLQRVNRPKTYVDRSLGIDIDGVRDNPFLGVVLQFDRRTGGELPKTDWPQAMPEFEKHTEAKVAWHTRRIEDRMRIHSLAYYPRRSITATEAIQAMRYDEDALAQEAYLAEECAYVPATKLVLQVVQRHYGNERMIHYLGDRNRMEVERVMAEDIHFKDINIVSSGSSMPKNRKLMKAEILELVRVGLYSSTEPKEAQKLRQLLFDQMQLESSIEMTDDELDVKKARAENMQLLAGQDIPPPRPGQNDAIHLYGPLCHMGLLKQPEYDNLEESRRKSVYRMLVAHSAIHIERLAANADETGLPLSQLTAVALSRIRPPQQQQQAPGPTGLPGPADQPIDTTGPGGVRIYRERPGMPKSGKLVGNQGGDVPPGE